jgi:hypothetical protein
MLPLDRRRFLAASALAASGGFHAPPAWGADTPRSRPPKRAKPAPKKVALLTSVYRYLSHSYHIAGRFLHGYLKGGEHHFPDLDIASAYVEQVGQSDLSRDLAREYNFRLSETIEDALTLGTGKLAVDAVLLVCEHGDYRYNAKGQKLYPRHDYFKKVAAVFEKSGRSVPVFNDKHLSYDRKKAAEMVATAKKMGFPLMAGSSLPVTWRRPELEFKLDTKVTEALRVARRDGDLRHPRARGAAMHGRAPLYRKWHQARESGREGRHLLAGRGGVEGRRRRAVVVGVAGARARP